MSHKIVALLPMKANSERIKGKNFRPFCGKPLFQWVLDSLLAVPDIDLIVINTDAREYLINEGLQHSDRILIRDRKPEICGDFVSMNLIIQDDIDKIPAETYLMTHTTNPLLSPQTISDCISTYQSSKKEGTFDSLFTVNRHQTRFYNSAGEPVNHDPNRLIRTQDLEPWFEENSNLYLFTRESFAINQARIGKRPFMYEMPLTQSIDIDDQISWEIAESIAFKKLSEKMEG